MTGRIGISRLNGRYQDLNGHANCLPETFEGILELFLRPLSVGNITVDDLIMFLEIPQDPLAPGSKMANLSIFSDNLDLILGRRIIRMKTSYISPILKRGIT